MPIQPQIFGHARENRQSRGPPLRFPNHFTLLPWQNPFHRCKEATAMLITDEKISPRFRSCTNSSAKSSLKEGGHGMPGD